MKTIKVKALPGDWVFTLQSPITGPERGGLHKIDYSTAQVVPGRVISIKIAETITSLGCFYEIRIEKRRACVVGEHLVFSTYEEAFRHRHEKLK